MCTARSIESRAEYVVPPTYEELLAEAAQNAGKLIEIPVVK